MISIASDTEEDYPADNHRTRVARVAPAAARLDFDDNIDNYDIDVMLADRRPPTVGPSAAESPTNQFSTPRVTIDWELPRFNSSSIGKFMSAFIEEINKIPGNAVNSTNIRAQFGDDVDSVDAGGIFITALSYFYEVFLKGESYVKKHFLGEYGSSSYEAGKIQWVCIVC